MLDPAPEQGSPPGPAGTADPSVAAVLVIHGIGEQRPYETLDSFVQGVAVEFGVGTKQLEHRLVPCEAGILSVIRMPLSRPTPRGGARVLDFYEFHWAGMVEGRIGLRQVLGWLVRTALTPLRVWAQQAIVLLQIGQSNEVNRKTLAGLFVGEVARSVALLLVMALLVAPFVYSFTQPEALAAAWGALRGAAGTRGQVVLLAALAGIALVVLAVARGGIALLRQWRGGASTERASIKWWGWASIVTASVLFLAAFFVDRAFDLRSADLLGAIFVAISPLPVSLPLVAAIVAVILGRVLVGYLGDVALYTAADENSAYFRTRSAILKKSTVILRHLCEGRTYGAVYLAGHSLGSVIAYDTINRYARETRAGTAPAGDGAGLARLRGLLTFGSPLDAVYYFFRNEAGPDEPVRAQILSSLHGFRKRSSGRDYGRFTLAPYEVPRLPECRWLNVFSPTDLISRRLVFYKVEEQVSRMYPWSPLRAHLAYWRDRGFYALVARWL